MPLGVDAKQPSGKGPQIQKLVFAALRVPDRIIPADG